MQTSVNRHVKDTISACFNYIHTLDHLMSRIATYWMQRMSLWVIGWRCCCRRRVHVAQQRVCALMTLRHASLLRLKVQAVICTPIARSHAVTMMNNRKKEDDNHWQSNCRHIQHNCRSPLVSPFIYSDNSIVTMC